MPQACPNVSGSLREECLLRALISAGGEAEQIRQDATSRHFTPEQVENFLRTEDEFNTVCEGEFRTLLDFMQEDAELEPELSTDHNDDETGEEAIAFEKLVARGSASVSRPPAPQLLPDAEPGRRVWRRGLPGGTTIDVRLTEGQVEAYHNLKEAGGKRIHDFLSGQGGVGKSTLIALLVQEWRSQGLNVLVTGSSGKAAALLGGVTVHRAFGLSPKGVFQRAALDSPRRKGHLQLLATLDVLVIDEVSMLTADTLNAVDEALTFAMRRATASRGYDMSFGNKSVIVCGDLYQLPAVERIFHEDQPYMSHRWVEFTLSELTEIVRTDPDQIELAEMLSHARLGHEHLTQRDRQLLQSRVCACHGGHVPFTDVMRIRPPGGKAKDEREVSRQVTHCVPCGEATILAARRHKVQALNDAHVAERIDAASVVEVSSLQGVRELAPSSLHPDTL